MEVHASVSKCDKKIEYRKKIEQLIKKENENNHMNG